MKSKKFFGGQSVALQTRSNSEINDLTHYSADNGSMTTAEARALVAFEQANALQVLPLRVEKNASGCTLHVASVAESAQHVKQILQFCSGLNVQVTCMEKELLPQAIFNAYKHDSEYLKKSAASLINTIDQSHSAREALARYDQGRGDVAKFLTALIDYCIAEQASDLHLSPLKTGTRIRIRRDGDLLEHENIVGNEHTHSQLIKRLKVLAGIANINSNEPCDGAFIAGSENSPVRIRLSCMPSLYGENAVLRLHEGSDTLGLAELGYSAELHKLLLEYSGRPNGLVIFAGPTGSGKTTALYALIREMRAQALSVHTIEDPIEQTLDGIVQTAVQVDAGLTYAKSLKAILRQDPDVVVVGELRDIESAQLIVQAALTGHLVLTTVHARSVIEVIQRFRHFQVDSFDLFQALQVVVCQELCPRICERCRVLDLNGTRAAAIETSRSAGCVDCNYSCYSGRVPITEYLFMSRLKEATDFDQIVKSANLESLGVFKPFRDSVVSLVRSGNIDWQNARDFL